MQRLARIISETCKCNRLICCGLWIKFLRTNQKMCSNKDPQPLSVPMDKFDTHLVLRYDESRQILARVLTLISSGNRPRVPSTDAKCELSFCRFYNITSILQIATACTLRLRFLSKPFFNNLLGHAPVPQSWVSVFVPVQGRPPLAGGGLVQLRVRYCLPPPQDLEHWLKFEKTVQPPSIGTMDKPT